MKIIKKASRSAEEIREEAVEHGQKVKENIENDGGTISDFRVDEMVKAEFMYNALSQVDFNLYFIDPKPIVSELERIKGIAETGQAITSQDLNLLSIKVEDLNTEVEKLKNFVKEVRS